MKLFKYILNINFRKYWRFLPLGRSNAARASNTLKRRAG